eukprot:4320803-Amphidinium_carterae.1
MAIPSTYSRAVAAAAVHHCRHSLTCSMIFLSLLYSSIQATSTMLTSFWESVWHYWPRPAPTRSCLGLAHRSLST